MRTQIAQPTVSQNCHSFKTTERNLFGNPAGRRDGFDEHGHVVSDMIRNQMQIFRRNRNNVSKGSVVSHDTDHRTLQTMSSKFPSTQLAPSAVIAFGIGPLAGILAITVHTIGAQGKLFAEVNENISPLPGDGIRSAGGTWWQEIRFAVLPQVMPNYLSYTFWRLELNVRSATIVGFVGAGGIGHDLFTSVQLLYFSDAGAILLIIVATIMLIDVLSESFRHSAIGKASFAK